MLGRLRTIHLSDTRQRPRTIDALSFREDGSLAMLCRNDPLLYAFDLDLDADSLRVLSECAGDVSNASSRWLFSGDGASVIASSLDGVAVFRVDSGAERWRHQERVWPAPLGYAEINRTLLVAISLLSGEAFALDLHTGAEQWRVDFTDKITPPKVVAAIASGADLLLLQRGFVTRCPNGDRPRDNVHRSLPPPIGDAQYLGHFTEVFPCATSEPLRVFLRSTGPATNGMPPLDVVSVHALSKRIEWPRGGAYAPLIELPERSMLVLQRGRFPGAADELHVRALDDGAVLSTHAWNANQNVVAAALDVRRQRLALATDADTVELYALGR